MQYILNIKKVLRENLLRFFRWRGAEISFMTVRSASAIFVGRAVNHALQEARQRAIAGEAALGGDLCVAQCGVAQQIHGMQQSPLLQHFVERLAGEELDGSAQHRSFCAKYFGKGFAGEAGGAGEIGYDIF